MVTENKNIPLQELVGKAKRKILSYSDNLMLVELQFEKGGFGAMHSHPHEQIGYVISGKIIYHEDGCEDRELTAGDSYYVAPNVSHGIDVLEDSKLLDIFTPLREDFIK